MGNSCKGGKRNVVEDADDNTMNTAAKLEAGEATPEEIAEQALRDAFTVYDKNKDTVIQKEELSGVLEAYHGRKPTEKQLGKILSKVDLNQDGVIDFKEFCRMMNGRQKAKTATQEAFDSWDMNKDGYISRAELFKVLNQVEPTSDEEISEILIAADQDEDGRINISEYMNFFM